jgi:thiol-disulfide isomerase/thioredoxin
MFMTITLYMYYNSMCGRASQPPPSATAMLPTWTLLTWALLPSGAFSGPYSFEQDGVLLAGQANFEDLVVYSGQLTLVLFYSPSCPYCVKLEPEFKSAARNLGREQVRAVAVDAVQERGLADYCECAPPHHSPQTSSALTRRLGSRGGLRGDVALWNGPSRTDNVSGYPTLKLFVPSETATSHAGKEGIPVDVGGVGGKGALVKAACEQKQLMSERALRSKPAGGSKIVPEADSHDEVHA